MRALLALVFLSSACTAAAIGDDPADQDSPSTPDPDPAPDPDPDPGADPDPDPGEADACPPSDLGTVDTLKGATAFIDRMDPDDPESPAVRLLSGLAGPDDAVELGLWDGYGAFLASPAAPGDYPIGGDDADPDTCGICLELRRTAGEVEHRLFATGGGLSLESVDGDLTGSATTLRFEEVDGEGELVPGGCTATITRLVFDTPLGAPP